MRGLRSTIALFIVLIGLSAYIYFVTWNQPEAGADAARDRVFAALESDTIDEIQVKAESGETTALKKESDVWQVTSPITAKADPAEVASITSNLESLAISRVVDDNPSDLNEYGLDMPRAEIEFKASGDKTYSAAHRLLIGPKSATGELFAKREGENRVVLIPGYVDAIFNRSTFNLRDKAVLVFERDKVERIGVSAGSQSLELVKQGMDWSLTRPIAAAADSVSVDGLINRLNTLQMKSIVTDQATPADLKQYGFSTPQSTVAVTAAGATQSLFIGGKSGADLYARDSSRPLVVTTDSSVMTDLQKGPDEYRRKEILAFRGYSGDRLEFSRDGQTISFEKITAEGQPDKWRRTSPSAGEPEAMNMESLLLKLEGIRATSFRSSTTGTGLEKPTLSVYARSDAGKKEERVAFARGGSGAPDAFASVPGQPGAVVLPGKALDDMIAALDLVSK
jgi:hypothetical protein